VINFPIRLRSVRALLALAAGLVSAVPAGGACAPLAGGLDAFPSTAKLVLDDVGFAQPFVVRLSSAGLPDGVLQRSPQIGTTITTELLQLQLGGFHPRVGAITLRESPSQPSTGAIRNVVQDGACKLGGGEAFLDVFVELELPGLGQTWVNQQPFRLESPLEALPFLDVRFEVSRVVATALYDKVSGAERGELFYTLHHLAPPFPPAGSDCFDTLLTANLELFGPGMTVPLFGFGPTEVTRGSVVPGGTCNLGGTPCDADADCPALDTCKRPLIDTEIVALDLGGFDILLGDWQTSVLPDIGDSNCCIEHGTPGCSDPRCESLICDMDPFCCNVAWDGLCASLAASQTLCLENCLDPDANPSLGTVKSVQLNRTYPATSSFNLFVRIDTDLQGPLHNGSPIKVQPTAPITNLPPNPNTSFLYTGAPVTMLSQTNVAVGRISNIVHTLQPPRDCGPPPAAAQDCVDSWLVVELALPPCPPETLWLAGSARMLRDNPAPGGATGQEVIESVLAKGEFAGFSSCSGSLAARIASTASGAISSLTPEEFFPADSVFEVSIALDAPQGNLTAGPAQLATTIDALPAAPGEIYFGPEGTLALFDGNAVEVGQILSVRQEFAGPTACPAGFSSRIVFSGPTRHDFDVSIPGGGTGVEYDVVRGSLGSLLASQGAFSSASCLFANAAPALSDTTDPAPGQGYFYVARDGLGAFDGTWNGSGPSQAADRDLLLPDCP